MPRFFFHIVDGRIVQDEEGQEFANLEDAKADAVASARAIMRDALWEGRLPLNESIQIADDQGHILTVIRFRDTVTIEE